MMNKEPFHKLVVDGVDIPLQRYPHIGHKLALLWGTKECLNYLCQLLEGTDRDPRAKQVGFDMGTAEILLELLRKHPTEPEILTYRQGHFNWKDTDHGRL